MTKPHVSTIFDDAEHQNTSFISLKTLPPYKTIESVPALFQHCDRMSFRGSAGNDNQDRQSRVQSTDGGVSFFTAKGTLRSTKADGTVTDEEVLVYYRGEAQAPEGTSSALPSVIVSEDPQGSEITISPSCITIDETPFPSRVLRLYHPPPQLTVQDRLDKWFEIDSWSLIDQAKGGVERAFWGFFMPSVAGIKVWSDSIGELVQGWTIPLLSRLDDPNNANSRASVDDQTHQTHQGEGTITPRLYSDETIYTLRIPPYTVKDLDLGKTAQPVFIKKRAAIPDWTDGQGVEHGWGKKALNPGWR